MMFLGVSACVMLQRPRRRLSASTPSPNCSFRESRPSVAARDISKQTTNIPIVKGSCFCSHMFFFMKLSFENKKKKLLH